MIACKLDITKFLNLCTTIISINQFKKKIKHYLNTPYIEVNQHEINQTMLLASELLRELLEDFSILTKKLLNMIIEMNQKTFIRKEVRTYTE